MPHLTEIVRTLKFQPKILTAYRAGQLVVATLPPVSRRLMEAAIKGDIRAGVASDFDCTLVPTDEHARKFFILGQEDVGCLEPFAGLPMLGIPSGVISGNTTEYVTLRCANPVQDKILNSPERQALSMFAAYALNGGHLTLFDSTGADDSQHMDEYNRSMRLPTDHASALFTAMSTVIRNSITKPLEQPITIRAGLTTSTVFAPIIENRAGVQICSIGVPSDQRPTMVDGIRILIPREIRPKTSVHPGGQYSIDGQSADLQKPCAGRNFKKRFGLDHTFYLGDAVYKHGDKEGNDYAMVHNPDTTVLAVNENRAEVPAHDNVHWLGNGPKFARDWLTWFFIERANFLFQQTTTDSEKLWQILQYLKFICDE